MLGRRRSERAGKTTFAREFLPNDARVLNFVNADLIAGGLSPLKPELAAIAAGRLVLKEIDRLVDGHEKQTCKGQTDEARQVQYAQQTGNPG